MTFRSQFQHRDALLHAAIEEFCAFGYDAASINRILDASGVSKGQLYHHFAGKEGLYLALVEWMIDEKVAWLLEHPVQPTADDLFSVLRSFVHASLAFAYSHRDVERLSRALLAERGRPIFEVVTRRFSFGADDPLDAIVRHHHAQGELSDHMTAEFATRVVGLLVNNAPDLVDLKTPDDLDTQLDSLFRFLERGLAGPVRRKRGRP